MASGSSCGIFYNRFEAAKKKKALRLPVFARLSSELDGVEDWLLSRKGAKAAKK